MPETTLFPDTTTGRSAVYLLCDLDIVDKGTMEEMAVRDAEAAIDDGAGPWGGQMSIGLLSHIPLTYVTFCSITVITPPG